jgi:protein-tyrosine phosphatase
VRSWRDAGISLIASLLTPEEVSELGLEDEGSLCQDEGLEFRALPIPDRGVPPSRAKIISLVAALEQALESGSNVGVHCRQGVGRSALLLASVLVAAGDEPEQAFRSIEKARGAPVPDTREQRDWVEAFAETVTAKAHPA